MIGIKEIAKLAQVSPSTVSKALNNRTDVSEKTRTEILQIAEQHHYRPPALTRVRKREASENIGIIFSREQNPLSDNPFYSRVLEGIESELAINSFNLVLNIIQNKTPQLLPKMVREKQVDGIILIGNFNSKFLGSILTLNLPTIFLDPQNQVSEFSQIMIDNEHGAFVATEYLIQAGHKKIGFISADLGRQSFYQRHEGYLKALKFHKIDIKENLIRTGGIECGYELTKDLVSKERPTAIFAANDINALHGYRAIHDLDLQIPQDVSIIGFDDIRISSFVTPPLTTIRVHKKEMGSIAVRALLKIIHRQLNTPITAIVPVELIERESVLKL